MPIKKITFKYLVGFTLLELMIVFSIIAIILGFGVPTLNPIIANARLIASANEMLSALQLARSEAAKSMQYSGVVLDGNKWSVYLGSKTNVIRYYMPSSNVTLHTDITEINYGQDARLNSATSIVLIFESSTNSTRTLTVSPSGKINISNP